jgi:membrane protease subunit HflK
MKLEDLLKSRPVFKPERRHVAAVAAAIAVLLALSLALTSFFTVQTESVGIVTRFGGYHRTEVPGLRFKLPLGIDRVQIVEIQRQQKEEFGFQSGAPTPGVRTQYRAGDFNDESLMVTGDLNAADVQWSVQYRINDPVAYLFNVRYPVDTLRYASEAVMREVVGDHTVDEVLTVLRQPIGDNAQVKLQALMNTYAMGIHIDRVVLQDVTPPSQAVQNAFNEVNQAQQEREKLINEARAEYNREIPRARGEAQQKIQAANGYAAERVNQAEGDAGRFNAIYEEYRKAPEVTRRRMYLETMGQVIPKLGRKFVIDENARSILPMLPLSGAMEAPQR